MFSNDARVKNTAPWKNILKAENKTVYSKYDSGGKDGLYDYLRGSCGGYKISPAHIIQNDVTPEHVLKFIELCKKTWKLQFE